MSPLLMPIIGIAEKIFDRVIPDKAAAEKAKQELASAEVRAVFDNALAQVAVNMEEAKSPNWFVAGWRPAVGWICAAAFAYAYVFQPFALYLAFTFGSAETAKQIASMPSLELGAMLPVLFGMLGLGGLRTYEKRTDAEGKR